MCGSGMKKLKVAVAISVLLSVMGCQSTSDTVKEISTNQQESNQDNAYHQYELAKKEYDLWLDKLKNSADLKIYSKDNYSDLLSAWEDAVEIYQEIAVDPAKTTKSYSIFSSGSYSEAFDDNITIVQESYNRLLDLKIVADEVLSDSQAQMAYLNQIGAVKVYPTDYQYLEKSYVKLYKAVEDTELEDAQTAQVVFLNKAKELETKVVLKQFVFPLKNELSKLRSENFDDIAAISFAKAKAEIRSAEQVVKANTRELTIIEEAVSDAKFELNHVRNIASEVKLLSSVEREKFEPIVLTFENKLLSISQSVNGEDYRNKSLRVQAEKIVASIELTKSVSTSVLTEKDNLHEQLKEQIAKQQQEMTQQLKIIAQVQSEKGNLADQLEKNRGQVMQLEALVASFKAQALINSQKVAAAIESTNLIEATAAAVKDNIEPSTDSVQTTPLTDTSGVEKAISL